MSRLTTLSASELRTLLAKYFDRVVDLREQQRLKDHEKSELEVRKGEIIEWLSKVEAVVMIFYLGFAM